MVTYRPEEILHLYPGAGGPRAGATLKAWSFNERADRVVAQIDYLVPQLCLTRGGGASRTRRVGRLRAPRKLPRKLAVMSIDGKLEATLVPSGREGVAPAA